MLEDLKTKALTEIGFGFGTVFGIAINWRHILEMAVETAILAFIGGAAGALGGLFIGWIKKKRNDKRGDSKDS